MKRRWIGEKEFGVEYELRSAVPEPDLAGRIRWLAGGHPIGSWDETSLRDVLMAMSPVLRDRGHRCQPALFALSASDLVRTLAAGLSGDDPAMEERASSEEWARLDVCPRVDPFDGWIIHLVSDGSVERLAWSLPSNPDDVHEVRLPAGTVDSVLLRAWEALHDELAAAEARRDGP